MLLSNDEIHTYSMCHLIAFQELHPPSHILKWEQQALVVVTDGSSLFFSGVMELSKK